MLLNLLVVEGRRSKTAGGRPHVSIEKARHRIGRLSVPNLRADFALKPTYLRSQSGFQDSGLERNVTLFSWV